MNSYYSYSGMLAFLTCMGFLLASNQDTDKTSAAPPVAIVNYGKVLFAETELAAYQKNSDGMMVPSMKLNASEVETLTKATERMKLAIEKIAKKHDISLVLRIDSTPADMMIPISSALWQPAPDNPIRVMTQEEKEDKLRDRLFLDLDARIAYQNRLDLTKMIIKELRHTRGVK